MSVTASTTRSMRFLPVSDQSLLVELQDLAHTLDLLAALQAQVPVGVRELVPAARTILIEFDRWQTSAVALRRHIGVDIDTKVEVDGAKLGTANIDPLVYGVAYVLKF